MSVDSVHAQSHPDPISDRRVPRLDRVSHIDLHAQPHFQSSLSSKRHIPMSPTPIHQPTTTLSKTPYASKKIPLYYTYLLPVRHPYHTLIRRLNVLLDMSQSRAFVPRNNVTQQRTQVTEWGFSGQVDNHVHITQKVAPKLAVL